MDTTGQNQGDIPEMTEDQGPLRKCVYESHNLFDLAGKTE